MSRPLGATLEDVAEEAGVSLATASRCINHPESVRKEKRERILAAVERLDYIPHGAARALASKRTRMIGAVFPTLESTLFGGALESFQDVATASGYSVLVASSNYDLDLERTHIRNLIESGVEALLLVGALRDPDIYRFIDAKGIPYVISWIHNDDDRHAYVGFDNKAAATQLTEYLLTLGHTRLGIISGHAKDNDRAQSRLDGIYGAVERAGLARDDVVEFQRNFTVENGRDIFRQMMGIETPPTAVICGSEPFAYGALFEAARMKIKIPKTVSVVSFDDMWLASHLSPALTTMRTPRREMGTKAADYLIARLEGESPADPAVLETELIVRRSTGPVPKS